MYLSISYSSHLLWTSFSILWGPSKTMKTRRLPHIHKLQRSTWWVLFSSIYLLRFHFSWSKQIANQISVFTLNCCDYQDFLRSIGCSIWINSPNWVMLFLQELLEAKEWFSKMCSKIFTELLGLSLWPSSLLTSWDASFIWYLHTKLLNSALKELHFKQLSWTKKIKMKYLNLWRHAIFRLLLFQQLGTEICTQSQLLSD